MSDNILHISVGRLPARQFDAKFNSVSDDNCPISVGMVVMPLFLMERYCNEIKTPITPGKDPNQSNHANCSLKYTYPYVTKFMRRKRKKDLQSSRSKLVVKIMKHLLRITCQAIGTNIQGAPAK
jgi:hypothetical protein